MNQFPAPQSLPLGWVRRVGGLTNENDQTYFKRFE
jgi:hypothetical protein